MTEHHPELIPSTGQRVQEERDMSCDIPEWRARQGWVMVRSEKVTADSQFRHYTYQRLVDDNPTPPEEPATDVTPEPEPERPNGRESRRITGGNGDKPANSRPHDAERIVEGLQIEVKELRSLIHKMAEQQDQPRGLMPIETPLSSIEPVMMIDALRRRQEFLEDVVNDFFIIGIHYGEPFPGSKDKMLYKMGAEWIASSFGMRPEYEELDATIERGDKPFVHYRYRCNLRSIQTGQIAGSAIGQCSSEEDKYKYQQAKYKCPSCGNEAIIKDNFAKDLSKEGWVCYRKGGGCGAKYAKNAAEIMNQPKPRRSLNTEVVGLAHTIDAMAQKRAFGLAVREVLGLSSIFKYIESLNEPAENGDPVVVNSTAKEKMRSLTPVEINGLIDFTISLDPERMGKYKRTEVGKSVLAVFAMNDWSDPFMYTLEEAQTMIRAKVMPAAESTPQQPPSGQQADTLPEPMPATVEPPAPEVSELDEYLGPRETKDAPAAETLEAQAEPEADKSAETEAPKADEAPADGVMCTECGLEAPDPTSPYPTMCKGCGQAAADRQAKKDEARKARKSQ